MYRLVCIVIALMVLALAVGPAVSADWPRSMDVGGFAVTGISGSASPDGSGRAVGKLSVPGDGSCPVDLSRSASGAVTGSMRSSFTLSGVRLEGSFLLDRQGLQGTGTVHTGGKPISDANIRVDSRNGAAGRGRVYFSPGFSVGVAFEVGQRGLSVKGSSPRQVSIDTPLALYTFKGDVDVSSVGSALKTSAKGVVERKGKIGGMISAFGPLSFDVNPTTGAARLNAGGADIAVDLW